MNKALVPIEGLEWAKQDSGERDPYPCKKTITIKWVQGITRETQIKSNMKIE